ncbi:uncharacterized protein [Parasteatoda tepidariorum]|uniref:uncharacterized protein n=1 Tax=Parasteatoda tepidariorum TaxID=114398 RepID=UPI001C727802|nr:uncharacterized protein LOC122269413 isoform X1 [Parasteatoda tepidariorum]
MQIFVKCAANKLDSSWDIREEPKLGDIYLTVPSESEEDIFPNSEEEIIPTETMTVAADEFIGLPTASYEENNYVTEDTTTSESSSSVTLSWAELFMILQKKAFPSEAKTLHHSSQHSLTMSTTESRESIASTEVLNDVQTIVDNLLKYNRETGEQLVKLKKALLTSRKQGKKTPRIKIKINAQAPVRIKTEYVNGKNVLSKGIISVLKTTPNHQTVNKKEKLEKQETTIIGPPLEQETSGELEKARKQFIKKGAIFLRHAWNRFLTQKLKHSLRNEELETDN